MNSYEQNIGSVFFSGRNIFIFLMLLYPLANFLVFYVVVNFNSVLMAFQSTDEDFNAVFSGFANFRRVFETLGANGYLFQLFPFIYEKYQG